MPYFPRSASQQGFEHSPITSTKVNVSLVDSGLFQDPPTEAMAVREKCKETPQPRQQWSGKRKGLEARTPTQG